MFGYLNDELIESVAYDGSEVCDAMWATSDKVKAMMEVGDMLSYPYFEDMVKWRAEKCKNDRAPLTT
jgi:NADH pyrophosphatase NudC (nudix superfamily)